MAEFAVWGGVSLIMLLILLAIISSTALVVGAISAMQEQHAAGHGFIAIPLALVLAAVNFFGVQRAGLAMAAINGNCGNTCLVSGSFQFAGTPEQAKAALKAAGAWNYGIADDIDGSNMLYFGHHPYTEQFRFGSGPSPHFSVPDQFLPIGKWPRMHNPKYTVPATGDFHIDATVGGSHFWCANFGVGC